jgi:hypothetical protein
MCLTQSLKARWFRFSERGNADIADPALAGPTSPITEAIDVSERKKGRAYRGSSAR